MYIRSLESDGAGQKPYKREVWLPVANICVTGLLKEGGSTELLTPFPSWSIRMAAKRSNTRRNPATTENHNFRCPSQGHLTDVSYRLLQSLPTNPGALLNWLKSQKKYTNDGPLQEIFETLGENIMPPAVAAAFYRAGGPAPGRDHRPRRGERGQASTASGSPGPARTRAAVDQYEMIFDKTTLQNIGEKQFDAKTGRVDFQVAIQQRAFVDKAGELP